MLPPAYPEKVEACRNLLQVISKRSAQISLQNDPALQFVNLQVHLTTAEIISKIEKQNVSHTDIFDDCENLCQLFSLLTVDRGYICLKFAKLILQLCTAVAEVCNLLERKCNAKVINWPVVGNSFVEEAKVADAKRTRTSFLDYIPKLSDFEQVCRISAGNFSEVYLVTHKGTGHPFAMKISPTNKFDRDDASNCVSAGSKAEASGTMRKSRITNDSCMSFVDKMLGSLTHDFLVCRIFCSFRADPDVDITLMDVGDGEVDVLQLIDHLGYLSAGDALMIALQATLGIEHIHLRGFIHRDIRPSNFVIDRFGKLKIVDFDSARVCRGHFAFERILAGFFKRTANELKDRETVSAIPYTAPEVLNKKSWGRAIDWWSLGISIYKMTTGRLPFRGSNSAAVIESVCNEELKWPKASESPHSATPDIKEYVYDLLKKNPMGRLGTKIYSDLLEPTAVHGAIESLRPVHTLKDGGPVRDLRTKLYIISFSEIDRNLTKDLKTPVTQLVMNRVSVGTYNLSELRDKTEESLHYPLTTFSHPKFRRFTDRQSGTFPMSEKFLVPLTPPDRKLDYYKAQDDAETLIGMTMQETAVQREAQVQLVKATFTYRTKLFCCKTANIKLRLVQGEGKLTYPVVYAKSDSGAEQNIDEANYGDIMVSIEKSSLIGSSMEQISAILRSRMKKTKGTIKCQVLRNNIFRHAYTDRVRAFENVTRSPQADVTLSSPRSKYFQTRILKLWNQEARDFIGFHVVIFVHPDVTPSDGHTMIFYGDVLLQLNGHDVSHVDPAEVERLYRDRPSIGVVFYQTSVLRRKDLHEAGIEETDFGDTELERMLPGSSTS
ncbi:uncharacterized protein LOC108864183 [Galendromus occidentalis]|uniref:Serine/threonine-protein kinase greatwall n=1 Tax=Galendromus occidentalis TaxID=34638 RepID=A0AAJ7L3U7_9ACAR|nr:uncharacterized protein LOC108864183 [Galendromus occidentalis]